MGCATGATVPAGNASAGNANSGKPGGPGGYSVQPTLLSPPRIESTQTGTAPPAGSTSVGTALPAGATPTGVPAGMTASPFGGMTGTGGVYGYGNAGTQLGHVNRGGGMHQNNSGMTINRGTGTVQQTPPTGTGQPIDTNAVNEQLANMPADQYNAAMQAMFAGSGTGLAGKMQNAGMAFTPDWVNTAIQRGYFSQRAKTGGLMGLYKSKRQ